MSQCGSGDWCVTMFFHVRFICITSNAPDCLNVWKAPPMCGMSDAQFVSTDQVCKRYVADIRSCCDSRKDVFIFEIYCYVRSFLKRFGPRTWCFLHVRFSLLCVCARAHRIKSWVVDAKVVSQSSTNCNPMVSHARLSGGGFSLWAVQYSEESNIYLCLVHLGSCKGVLVARPNAEQGQLRPK